MSIDFVPNNNISFSEVKTFNYKGVTVDMIEDGNVLLTDGTNLMWAYPRAEIETYNNLEFSYSNPYEGVMFTRYAGNDPIKIIEAIEDFFNIRLICEYEDEYGKIVSP
ncbi:MAG: hypothetical protein CVU54_14490 [Deltaproteobacteria bacterium HGW-Deltaproteobacteria-12]|jgi:hypothetical protein|nr:MAG: hypothetical protein CVU54_14490 [Deltaproteobacteria bacterium HGW-Deltaproteobacteria-12]